MRTINHHCQILTALMISIHQFMRAAIIPLQKIPYKKGRKSKDT